MDLTNAKFEAGTRKYNRHGTIHLNVSSPNFSFDKPFDFFEWYYSQHAAGITYLGRCKYPLSSLK